MDNFFSLDVMREDDEPNGQPLMVIARLHMDDGDLLVAKSLESGSGDFLVQFDPSDWRPSDHMFVPDLAMTTPVAQNFVLKFWLGDAPHDVVIERSNLLKMMGAIEAKAHAVTGRLQ